ncbi:uncharacterized protein EDB93DRAFT_723008 [Suillus bovinus]|uniref:uncharacterized protein n=1 Tax=Suillus bovinus TaxID=48563 RepID=UPI001B86C06D|nr:uncharacterized protein EDB93DRAFT_723008 [Suillus bovinus]KAG2138414.1 hypothetical protein EDB93DRAFT_723008 [Suillus bovinus]
METDSQHGVSHVQHHPEFYLPDGNITFLVENTFFRVHRSFFERESQVFVQELAQVPQDGISDDSAFRVEDVTSDHFATLLWVWYSPKYRLDRKSSDNWLVILELSTRWQFPEMKKLAIDQLQNLKMDPVEKIAIYNKYEIDRSLLLPEYKHLCTREGQMSIEEGEKVGLLTVLAIHQARERAMQSATANECRSPTPADVNDEELEQILRNIFNLNPDSTTRSRRGADIQALSGDTNFQGAQAQGQSNAPPIIGTPRPDASRTTNGTSGLGSVSQVFHHKMCYLALSTVLSKRQ